MAKYTVITKNDAGPINPTVKASDKLSALHAAVLVHGDRVSGVSGDDGFLSVYDGKLLPDWGKDNKQIWRDDHPKSSPKSRPYPYPNREEAMSSGWPSKKTKKDSGGWVIPVALFILVVFMLVMMAQG